MFRRIIVLGCDNTGKTTLINYLKEVLPFHQVVKGDYAKDTATTISNGYKNWQVADKDRSSAGRRIYDRFQFPDEFVYSAAKNIEISPKDTFDLFSMYMKTLHDANNTVIVYVEATEEVIKKRFALRGEDYVDEGSIPTILSEYNKYLSFMEQGDRNVPIIRVNSSYVSEQELADLVLRTLVIAYENKK